MRGRKVVWYQSETSSGVRPTTFGWRDLARDGNHRGAIHMRMPKDAKPDPPDSQAYEAAGFPVGGREVRMEFSGAVWEWRGPAPFFLVDGAEPQAGELRDLMRSVTYGWGIIRRR